MADIFLDYAQTALKRLPADYTVDELRAMLQFAVVVWNATVLGDIRGAYAHLATQMPRRLQVHPSKEWPTIKRLLVRKHRDFRLDAHFIAAMGVQPSGGKAYVTAIGVCPDPRCCGPQAEA